MATTRLCTIVIGAVLALEAPAFADKGAFFEADAGMVFPVAGDEYNDNVDESFKFGLRIGTLTKFGGIDLGFDYTPYNDNVTPAFTDVDVQRFRLHIGARINHPIGRKATLFARFGAGLDLIHYKATAEIINFENSETDAGIALDVSAGVLFDLGKVKIGAKLGLPMAFHFNEDDPMDTQDADLEYNALDVDIAFVVSIPF
jgi:hypothetical protein